MKWKLLIFNFGFVIIDAYFIVTGALNFNAVFHPHIISIFRGQSDTLLGWFWLICLAHDLIIVNLMILVGFYVRRRN
jgi:hypothetical protein